MTEAAEARALVLAAVEKVNEASQSMNLARSSLTDIGVQMNTIHRTITDAQRALIRVISTTRDALASAQTVVAGTSSGKVAQAISYLSRAEEDQTDDLRKLQFMRDQIEKMQKEILPILQRNNTESAGYLRGATGELNGYANFL